MDRSVRCKIVDVCEDMPVVCVTGCALGDCPKIFITTYFMNQIGRCDQIGFWQRFRSGADRDRLARFLGVQKISIAAEWVGCEEIGGIVGDQLGCLGGDRIDFGKFTGWENSIFFQQCEIDFVELGAVIRRKIFIDGTIFAKAKPVGSSCLLYTSPSPRDGLLSRMPSSA